MAGRALIVVDMLNDFIDEKGALYIGETAGPIIPFIGKELAAFRARGDLVIFVQDSHAEDDPQFKRYPMHCVDGTWGNEMISELVPLADEKVVKKTTLDAFLRTDLETILESAGIDAVEVVGVCTSICVMDLVGGLAARGYKIFVPRKGVADFDAEFHEFSLKRMQQVYGAKII